MLENKQQKQTQIPIYLYEQHYWEDDWDRKMKFT